MNTDTAPQTSGLRSDLSNRRSVQQVPPSEACTAGVCVVCGGRTLIEIRGKLQCGRCHTICETCCEGGRA